jgi:HSP20 family protein
LAFFLLLGITNNIVNLKNKIMNLIRKQTPFFSFKTDDFLNPNRNLISPSESNSLPAVNIKELETLFEIELAAPGKTKEDFEIEIEDSILSISSSLDDEGKEENERYTRREFSYNSFKRTFTIPDSVNADKIDANYTEGVLYVSLPKLKESLPLPKKLIKIS